MRYLSEILGGIPEMLAHFFQIILNFLYVCQSVSWLTFLLKLDNCRNISSSVWYIFLKVFGDIPKIFLDYFQIIPNFLYVCQSASWLTSLLKLGSYRDISSSVWDIFLKFFGGIPGMFVHLFQIILNFLYVCQSVSWLTFLLKLGYYRYISSSGWGIFLDFLGGFPELFLQWI